jgi:hypothetical protein
VNSSSSSCILAYWHLLRPVIESTDSVCTKFATRLPFQSDRQRHGRLMGAQAADVDRLFPAPAMRRHMGFAFDRTNPLFSMVSVCLIESPMNTSACLGGEAAAPERRYPTNRRPITRSVQRAYAIAA